MNMRMDPFDPELLSAYEYVARLYPGLDLNKFRLLWQEAANFMDDALERGYQPEEVPGLLMTDTAPSIESISSRAENRPPGIKSGPRRLEKMSQDSD